MNSMWSEKISGRDELGYLQDFVNFIHYEFVNDSMVLGTDFFFNIAFFTDQPEQRVKFLINTKFSETIWGGTN